VLYLGCTWVALCRISELQSPTRYNVLRYLRNVVYYLCCSMQNLNEHQRLWCISYAESLKDIWKSHLEHNFSSSQKFGSSTLGSQAAAQYLQNKRSSSDKKLKLLNLRKCRNLQKQYIYIVTLTQASSSWTIFLWKKFKDCFLQPQVHDKLEENLKDQAALAACRIQKNLAQRFTWDANIYQTWTVQQIVNLKFYLRETQELHKQ
jgi:hypothetical protein